MNTHDEDDVIIERDGREEDGMSEDDLEAVESRAGAKTDKVKKELEQVKKEKQEYLDGWQRAKADYANALRRFEEDKKSVASTAVIKAVKAILPAYDALERAKAIGELPEGFAGIAKQLEGGFASIGLESIGKEGDAFDPNLHEALGMDPTDDAKKDDTISAILEPGYRIGDSILRPARVRVFHHD